MSGNEPARKARAVGINHIALEVGDIGEALAFTAASSASRSRGEARAPARPRALPRTLPNRETCDRRESPRKGGMGLHRPHAACASARRIVMPWEGGRRLHGLHYALSRATKTGAQVASLQHATRRLM